MNYSYTQISQYLTCPRRYRHRYLDGWQEKDTRAAMLFGRAFERALAAYFLHEDAPAVRFSARYGRAATRTVASAAPWHGCSFRRAWGPSEDKCCSARDVLSYHQ